MAFRRFVLAVLLAGFGTVVSGQQSTAPTPPGALIDLGKFRVHIYCAGIGNPPVVFLHGLGDYSFDWALVQSKIAAETKACVYDRPAQAWSEPGPPPRGIKTSAHELQLLLERSNVKGPYVLVAHSWGGLIARMYAHEYPENVVGMVLVDSTQEDEYLWINGKIIRPRLMTDEEWSDLTKPQTPIDQAPSGDLKKQDPAPPPPVVKLEAPYDKLPPAEQKFTRWAMSLPYSKARFEGGDTLDIRKDFIEMHRVAAQSERSLGSIPLVILSKTPAMDNDDDYKPDQLAWNQNSQTQLVKLSTNSKHVIAAHSGHHIQLDEPDLVIDSILSVVDAVKYHRPLKAEPDSKR